MAPQPSTHAIFPDDARLRHKGLMDYVRYTQEEIQTHIFPGSAELDDLIAHFQTMSEELFKAFELATEKLEHPEKRRVRHLMVDKLEKEWEKVVQIAANSRLLGYQLAKDKKASWLDQVVATAQKDLGIFGQRFVVIPRFSQRYSLTHFLYAPEFAALEMPITALDTPWEWSLLWHELAGKKVQTLKERDPKFFIEMLPPQEEHPKNDIFSFFEEISTAFKGNKLISYKRQKQMADILQHEPHTTGWSVNWVEELFEDACSVFTFQDDFIAILESILTRLPPSDDHRHPSPEIRLRMAHRLLNNNELAQTALTDQDAENLEKLIAKKIKDKIKSLNDGKSSSMALPFFSNTTTAVHKKILDAMRNFFHPSDSLGKITTEIKNELEEYILDDKSWTMVDYSLRSADLEWLDRIRNDYKEMLKLTLSDTDFGYAYEHDHTNNNITCQFYSHNQLHSVNHFWVSHT